MTRTHHRRRRSHREDEDSDVTSGFSTPVSAGHGRRCRSSVEMEAITERVMRPTTAVQIRSDLREGSDLDPVKVVFQRSARSRDGLRRGVW